MPTVDGNLLIGPSEQGIAEKDDYGTTREGLAFLDYWCPKVVPALPLQQVIRNFASLRPLLYALKPDNTGALRLGQQLSLIHIYRLCVALNVPLNTQFFTDSPEYHCQMIANNNVVGFVLEDCTEAYELNQNIKLLPIDDPRFAREMMLCFKRDKHLSEAGRQFKEHVIEYLGLE